MAWETATAQRTQRIAEDAASRAGMTLEQWLGEAIVVHAAHENAGDGTRPQASPPPGERARRPEPIPGADPLAIQQADKPRPPAAQDLLEAAIRRIERGLARNAEETLRALGSIRLPVEPSSAKPRDPVDQRLSGSGRATPPPGSGRDPGLATPALVRSAAAPPGEQRLDENPPPGRGPAHELKSSLKPDLAPPRLDLKDAVSQIAHRRHELDARSPPDRLSHWRMDFETARSQAENARPAARPLTPRGRDEASADNRKPAIEPALAPEVRSVWKASRGDIRALERKLDHLSRTNAELSAGCAGIVAMRAEIAEIRRSLADLAPRNAVVALEGAIRDLSQRVEILRQNGHRETLLAPLEAMAEEMRATVKAHDPQAVAAILEGEIRSIGAKIDSLGQSAVNPETFERIRAQTEEVRNLLAAAATRAAPAERLERQIGELADRVERLGASATPHLEIHQIATALADFRKEFERCTPLPVLVSIERRLEGIAARLDQEIARPVQATFDTRPFDDLARRIEGVREAVEARAEPKAEAERLQASVQALSAKLENPPAAALNDLIQLINSKLGAVGQRDGATPAVEQLLAQIVDKLNRLPQAIAPAPPPDMRPLEEAIRSLGEKLDRAAAPASAPVPVPAPALNGDAIESLADAVALRFPDRTAAWGGIEPQAIFSELADIHDKLDALSVSSDRSDALEPLVRQLLVKLQDSGSEPDEVQATARLDTVAAELSEMRAERAQADRSAELRLSGLQNVLERLVDRLAGLQSRAAADEPPPDALSVRASPAWPGGSAKAGATVQAAPAPLIEPAAAQPGGDDFLLEPGAGAPRRGQEGRDTAPTNIQRTSPGVSAHIAAARRAAQALAEGIAGGAPAIGETSADAAFAPKPLYANQKRFLLLAVVLAVAVAAAIRLGAPRLPSLQKSEPAGGAAKSTTVAPPGRVFDFTGAKINSRPIDPAPTASISAPPASPKIRAEAGSSVPDVLPALPAGAPKTLRDAAVAGVATAQYELGQRLFEGRGVAQDQHAAALWFERAATAGLAPAAFRLGALYQKGVGVARDDAAAKRWYAKAAEAGNARAAHNLAVMDAEPADGKADFIEAAKWFRKAADFGLRDSQYNLAVLYARGLGVERDLRQSWMWFSLAAAQGDQDAAKKRDEVAAKMDSASLAAAKEALSAFKAAKPDPAANEVEPPPGGWDAAPSARPLTQTGPAAAGPPRQAL